MTNKKDLGYEELEKVSGGYYDSEIKIDYIDTPLGQYETETYIGREVLILGKNDSFVACGTLLASYEKSYACGTRRHIKISLNPNYKHYYGDDDEFCVDDHSNFKVYLVNQYCR